jgi:two-component sensor histidine kinase
MLKVVADVRAFSSAEDQDVVRREQALLDELARLRGELAERDAMLAEVNHRAKNSLQMAMALLRIQGQASTDEAVREALGSAAERLGHISAVHEMLYEHQTDAQVVDLHRYLCRMRDALAEAYQRPGIELVVKGDCLLLDAQRTVRVALIAGEAIINAYKYAFPAGQGSIRVAAVRIGSEGRLTVSDDGVGFAAGARKGSLGMRLMRALAQALRGRVRLSSTTIGTTVTVTFPLE